MNVLATPILLRRHAAPLSFFFASSLVSIPQILSTLLKLESIRVVGWMGGVTRRERILRFRGGGFCVTKSAIKGEPLPPSCLIGAFDGHHGNSSSLSLAVLSLLSAIAHPLSFAFSLACFFFFTPSRVLLYIQRIHTYNVYIQLIKSFERVIFFARRVSKSWEKEKL